MSSAKRLAFFLPNVFTALNMACGFGSIVLSSQGKFYYGSMILLLGAIFDLVDGRIARITGTQSSFGEQFDSISDVISFGVAPAFLIYYHTLNQLGRIGIVVTFIYVLCGALRLARFNANIDKVNSDYFQGLPIPTAALAVVGYVLFVEEFVFVKEYTFIALGYTLFYSVLMISNFPFYSFKNSQWVKEHKKQVLFLIFIVGALVITYEQLMIGVVILTYVVISLIYFLTHKRDLKDVFLWKNDYDEDKEKIPH